MKFPFKKKWLIIGGVGLAVILLAFIAFAKSGAPKETFVTDTVKKGALSQTVEVTGELSPIDEASLSFATSGIVDEIYVSVGQTVGAGATLAALEAGDLYADVSRAQADLALARAGNTRSADIEIAAADVEAAEANLEASETERDNAEVALRYAEAVTTAQMNDAHLSVKEAEQALLSAETNSGTDTSDIKDSLRDELLSATSTVRSALSQADQILGVENTLYNTDFERELGAGNPAALDHAKDAFKEAADYRNQAETKVYALSVSSTDAEIRDAERFTSLALTKTDETLLYTRQALDATFADSVDLSLTRLNTFKANIDAARTNVGGESKALSTSFQAYVNAGTNGDQSVSSKELALERAKENEKSVEASTARDLAQARANLKTAESTISIREASLKQSKAQYAKANEGPRGVDIAPYAANVASANARLRKALVSAPFSGRITAITVDEGEAANFGTPVITLEALGNEFEITVDIPESDITKIEIGDKSEVTLDAFGDDTVFTGEVISIDRSEKLIEGVVFYEATVILTGNEKTSGLRSGMSADVVILTENKVDTLYIPLRAVLEKDGDRYVRIPHGETFEERTVTVGLKADNGLVEILSGLSEGETIIVSIKK
jgi:RND family efflux transporter MFP subunit